jgi:hypothetical protein
MHLHRLGIKFFMTDPHTVPLQEYIPVFQKWIQGQVITDHLLLDVHNYSHIPNGPGILLVAHEGNFSIDGADGRTGLLYFRKQPFKDPKDQLTGIVKTGLQACSLLQNDPNLKGRIRFRADELEVVANDRLIAPNNEDAFSELQPVLSAALQDILRPSAIQLVRLNNDPRERLTLRVRLEGTAEKIH